MEQIEFNLLDEPWIRVMTQDCAVCERSLMQTLAQSHEFLRLAGETPTQDVAVLRLLLAVLHTVFYRVDADGEDDPVEDARTAVARWRELWSAGRLPEKPIADYLEAWHDRFWLFHPERPFYQTPGADIGTAYEASKLNGELSESSNKPRLFPSRTGENKRSLSYAETARWLVTLMGFDDSSTKVQTGTGSGWLGQHVNLYASGKNLFETLMLNLVFLRDGKEVWEEDNAPAWENPEPCKPVKRAICVPDNQAALLTLQSRRVFLKRKDGVVNGYTTTGGDYFADGGTNAFAEQMTQWYSAEKGKTVPEKFKPAQPDPNRQLWRDFETIMDGTTGKHRTGVASWINTLKRKGALENMVVHFSSVGVTYKNNSSIDEIIADHVDFHAYLFDDAGASWNALIQRMISKNEAGAGHIKSFAAGLCRAAGCKSEDEEQRAVQEYYAAVDIPFREWLLSVDLEMGDGEELLNEKERQWRRRAYSIALRQGRKMLDGAGQAAFTGRWVKDKNDKSTLHCSSAEFNRFVRNIRSCFGIRAAKKEEADD